MATQPVQLASVDRAYDSPGWWYDLRGLFILTWSYRSHLARQITFFGEHLGRNHLEVAAGSGSLLDLMLKWRALTRRAPSRVVAIDYADSMLAAARHRFAGRDDVDVLRADVAKLPFESARFDTINVANAAHCFSDLDGALREMRRVLRDGGTLAMNVLLTPRGSSVAKKIAHTINTWGMKKGILFRPYESDEIEERIERAGFALEAVRVHGNALEIMARAGAKEAR